MDELSDVADRYDVIVVGARAAGAATSMLLARAGLRVLALERSAYGSDTLSTHALMRTGVLQLARFGLLDAVRATGAPAIDSTVFHYGQETLTVAIKPKLGVDALYAPRRTQLDRLLVDAAREAGAQVRHQVRVGGLLRGAHGRVHGVRAADAAGRERVIEAELVIGADGRKSSVARAVQAHRLREGQHAAGGVYAYFGGLPSHAYHWYYNAGVSAGVVPTAGGLACVFVCMPAQRYRQQIRSDLTAGFRRVLQETSPELASALQAANPSGRYFGFEGQTGYLKEAYGPGWALVGDAGYFKDLLTAHGISDALRDAELLAHAITGGGSAAALEQYQQQRDALSLGLFEISDEMAAFSPDMDRLQQLHGALSVEMANEFKVMAARGDRASQAA